MCFKICDESGFNSHSPHQIYEDIVMFKVEPNSQSYPKNKDGEFIRDTTKFLWLPTSGFVDHSLGYIKDQTRWLVVARVRQKLENGKWVTFEFLD